MNILFQSTRFRPENIASTYARLYSNGEVKMYDVDKRHKTIREWWTPRENLSDEMSAKLLPGELVLISGKTMQERTRA